MGTREDIKDQPKRMKKSENQKVDRSKKYDLEEAVALMKELAQAKFDETVDLAIRLGLDIRQSDQTVRGFCALPKGTGRLVRVAVFAKGVKAEEAEKAGADIVGAEDLAEKIKEGFLDFDRCIATPDMMGIVGQLGRFLGPRGLMPNPKLGTVAQDVEKAIRFVKGGAVEFRAEKAGIIHAGVGKVSFLKEDLVENISSFFEAVLKAKPSGAKGTYFISASISSTMGPGIPLNLSSTLPSSAA